jgi:hypothetical protein
MDSLAISRIFPYLPMTLSMFWHMRQINKTWFMVVAKIISWNAFEMVKVEHKPYLLFTNKIGSARICLQIVLSMN